MSRRDEDVGLQATVPPTEPPARVSGLEITVAPSAAATEVSGLEATRAPSGILPSGPRAAVTMAADHDVQLTVVDQAHYTMPGEFARGGLGRIVRARDKRTGRLVAIKEMLGSSSEIAKRFMREALLTANLQHPAIVPVYELGRWPNGEPFYAMKLVDGHSLEDELAKTKTLHDRIALLPTLLAVCEALAYAHGEAIIHRDLKPANVLVGKFGETVVIDWGLAKRLAEDDIDDAFAPTVTPLPTLAAEGQTIAGSVMGTPSYMPPEQARGDDLDPRADVYALGAILYHLLSGAAPYKSLRPTTVHELLDLVVKQAPPPLAALVPDAPPDLIAIVDKAMARDPADRYPTAKQLAEDLRRFTTGQLVGAHRYDRWTLIKRWLRRNRAAVTVAGVLLVVLAVTAVISMRSILVARNDAEHEAAQARKNLGRALAERGDAAEKDKQWGRAAMFYQASIALADDPKTRFAAGRAEARTIAPTVRHAGHTAEVHGIALIGHEAITVDEAGEVRRWALADGRVLASWKAPSPLFAVAASPDGARVAVAGDDGVIRILDGKLAPRGEQRGHVGRVFTLAYSPDGRLLASGGLDTTIRVTDDATTRVFAGHKQRVYHVAWSPDGKRLASASDDRTARAWDLDGKQLYAITAHTTGVKVVAWFPDGDRIVTSGWDSSLKLSDGNTGELIRFASPSWNDTGPIHSGIVIGGRLVVSGGESKVVKVWDPTTQTLVAALPGHEEAIASVAVTADQRWLVTAGRDRMPRVWDLGAAFRLARLGHQRSIRRLAWSGDGRTVVTSSIDNTLRLWDAESGQEIQRISPNTECRDGASMLGEEDRDHMIAGCANGDIYTWRVSDRSLVRTLTGTGRRVRHAVSPRDGKWIAAGHAEGWIHVWDAATGKLRAAKAVHDHHIYAVRALPDGTLLSSSLDNTVRRSTAELEVIEKWNAPGIDGLLDAAIDPRGRFLVGCGDGFPVFRWDLTKPGTPADSLAGHRAGVWSVDVSPDGALMASASLDSTIRIWDTARWYEPGYQPRVLQGPPGGAQNAAFSPDGTRLVTGHSRGAAIVWDVETWRPLRRLGAAEAGEDGTCTDFDSVPWNDPLEKLTILQSCLEPSGFERLSKRTHLVLENQVDLVEAWK